MYILIKPPPNGLKEAPVPPPKRLRLGGCGALSRACDTAPWLGPVGLLNANRVQGGEFV